MTELDAMQALLALDDDARERVIAWARARWSKRDHYGELIDRVREIVRQADGAPVRSRDITRITGIDAKRVGSALRTLLDMGEVQRLGRGLHVATAQLREAEAAE